jgi:hypothetical protein
VAIGVEDLVANEIGAQRLPPPPLLLLGGPAVGDLAILSVLFKLYR